MIVFLTITICKYKMKLILTTGWPLLLDRHTHADLSRFRADWGLPLDGPTFPSPTLRRIFTIYNQQLTSLPDELVKIDPKLAYVFTTSGIILVVSGACIRLMR